MARQSKTLTMLTAEDIGKAVEIYVQRKNGYPFALDDYSHGMVCHVGILEEFTYGNRAGEDDLSFTFRMRGWDKRETYYLSSHQLRVVVI